MALLWHHLRPTPSGIPAELSEEELDLVVAVVRLRLAGVLRRTDRALELGCGPAESARVLEHYFGDYVAVDGLSAPAEAGSFDLVICDLITVDRPTAARAVAAATEHLAADGIALILLPHAHDHRPRGLTWRGVADAVSAAGVRIAWVDGRAATRSIYCIARAADVA